MKMKNYILLIFFVLNFGFVVNAQEWTVPAEEAEKVSPYIFEEDMVADGEVLYENSCTSCHGTPTENNFMPFSPPPGDPASEQFQSQPDGALFYKIQKGRGVMPVFENILAGEEIWSLVAYIRSFNKEYVQPEFDYGDEVLSELKFDLDFDENIDKLVVKVFSDGEVEEGIDVSAFVVGMFGKFPLGKTKTNELGLAYLDVDPSLPGDKQGNLDILVRVKKGYAIEKAITSMRIAEPAQQTSLIEGRHLWSTGDKAPIWLLVTFSSIVVGIWGAILYIIFGLLRLKKIG